MGWNWTHMILCFSIQHMTISTVNYCLIMSPMGKLFQVVMTGRNCTWSHEFVPWRKDWHSSPKKSWNISFRFKGWIHMSWPFSILHRFMRSTREYISYQIWMNGMLKKHQHVKMFSWSYDNIFYTLYGCKKIWLEIGAHFLANNWTK